MPKKFLLTTYLLALSSTPTHAYPVWAELIANSRCEYLAMGFDFEVALRQALRDNSHWLDSMPETEVAAKVIQYATYSACPELAKKSIDEWLQKTAKPTQPVYRNEFKL
jgi:hypothetical protein